MKNELKTEHKKPAGREASIVERLVICFRYAWNRSGFWNEWRNKLYAMFLIMWALLVSALCICMQLIEVIFHPLWRLFLEPVKLALTKTDNA